jgi:glutamate---cysteine ligase / carboxylate-amine ligase
MVADSEPLIALVQSLARLALEDGVALAEVAPEILAENRFLAARDGISALIVDPGRQQLTPLRALLEALVDRCHPHAEELGCGEQLEHAGRLIANGGAERQRRLAQESDQLEDVVSRLADDFLAGASTV